MKQNGALLATDYIRSLRSSVLATLVLLVLSAAHVFAQGTVESAVQKTAPGTARITWPRATRALLRGEVLQARDFVLDDTVIVWTWKQPSVDTLTAVSGFVTRRPIASGEFMHQPAIAPATVIALGSTVKVLWQDGNVRLTLNGIATNSAALGAPVGVRLDMNRRVDGIAVGPNTVRLR